MQIRRYPQWRNGRGTGVLAAVIFPAFVVLLMLVASPSARAQATDEAVAFPVDLTPRFEPDRVTRYSLWQRRQTDTTMTLAGQTRDARGTMLLEGEIVWRVEDVKRDGGAEGTLTFDWLRAEVTGPHGDTQTIDTRRPASGDQSTHAILSAMTGVPIEIVVAADGSVASAKGADTIARKAPEGMPTPDELDLLDTATDLISITNAPSEADLRDSWNARFTWNHDVGKIVESPTYELSAIEMIAGIPIATVEVETGLDLKPDLSEFEQDGVRPTIRLNSGVLRAQMMFDLQRGEVVGRNAVRETDITIQLRLGEQTLVRRMVEVVQGQVLRIAEDE